MTYLRYSVWFLVIGLFIGLSPNALAQLPSLDFGFTGNSSGCTPWPVTFTIDAASNPPGTTYVLNFGDQSPVQTYTQSTLPTTVTHLYTSVSCGTNFGNQINSFGAILTATSPQGQSLFGVISPIRIEQAPTASFSASALTICAGSTVNFTNTSDPGVTYNSSGACVNTAPFYWDISNPGAWSVTGGSLGGNQGFPDDINAWLPTSTNNLSVQFNVPGTYQVALNIGNRCEIDQDVKTICVLPAPIPQFTLSSNIGCLAPGFLITANNNTTAPAACAPINYSWNWSVTPATGWTFTGASSLEDIGIQFNTAQNYTITLQAAISGVSNCSALASQTVNLTAQPTINIALTSVCAGGNPVQLSASPTNGTWSGAGVTPGGLFTPPTTTGTVSLVYTVPASGPCPQVSQNVPITVTAPPAISITPSSPAICPGSSIQLTASSTAANTNFTWSPGTGLSTTNGATVVASPSTTTTYTVTGSIGGGCSGQATRTVTVYSPPSVSIPTPAAVCPGQTVVLNASAASGTPPYSFNWSPGTGLSSTSGPSVTATVNGPATYSVTVTDNNSCTGSATVSVSNTNLPVVNANDVFNLCESNTPIALIATPAGGTWSNSPLVSPTGQFTPSASGTYTVIYTVSINGCLVSDAATITVGPLQQASITGPSSFCLNASAIQLNGTPAGGTWSGSALLNSNGVFNPTALGTYTLNYSFGTGSCASSATQVVVVQPSPSVVLNDQALCAGIAANVTAIANGGTQPLNYSWTSSPVISGSGATVSVLTSSNETISVTVTDANNCTASDDAVFTVVGNPNVDAGPPLLLCDVPGSVTLQGFSPTGGTWSGSANVTASGEFSPNGVGNFTLTYTYGLSGCSWSDDLQVSVVELAVADAGLNQQVCIGSAPINLLGSPDNGSWSGAGNLDPSGVFVPDAAGTFMLHYEQGEGNCVVEDSVQIVVYDLPGLSVNSAQYCNGQSATLDASITGTPGPYTFTWTPSIGLSATSGASVQSSVNSTQTYTVTATDGVGCTVTANSTVTVIPAPTVDAGDDLQICVFPQPLQLVDFSPAGGLWSGLSVSPEGLFNANAVGVYPLTYTYSLPNGCASSDQIFIEVLPTPVLDAGSSLILCVDNPAVQLQSNLPSSWSGSPYVAVDGLFQAPGPGQYAAIATHGTGTCQVRDTVQIEVFPTPSISLSDTNTCALAPISITASATGGSGSYQYQWSPALGLNTTSGATVEVGPTTTTIYTVTVTDVNQCTSSDEFTVTTSLLPSVDVGPDITNCVAVGSIPLPTANPANGSWSGAGILGNTFQVTTDGNFPLYYTVTGANGCSNTDTLEILVTPLPTVEAGPDLQFCIGGPDIQLTPTEPLLGNWSGGVGPDGVFSPSALGTTTIYWTAGTGICSATDSLRITVLPLPFVDAGSDTTVCISENPWSLVGFPATGGVGTWDGNGITFDSFNPQLSGIGSFELVYTFSENATGCANSDTLIATVVSAPVVNVTPSDLEVCLSDIPTLLTGSPTGGTWSASGLNLSSDSQLPSDSVWMLPNALGLFEAIYTFGSGTPCAASGTVNVLVTPLTVVDAGVDVGICVGELGVQLQGSSSNGSWPSADNPIWLSSAGAISATAPDTAWVYFEDGTGTCRNRDSARVVIFPNPEVDAGSAVEVCADAPCVDLTGANPSGGVWSGTGVIGNSFCPNFSGVGSFTLTYEASVNYTLQTLSATCTASDNRLATVFALPTADFTVETPACVNTSILPVNTSIGAVSNVWTFLEVTGNDTLSILEGINPSFTTPTTGIHQLHLEVESDQGCLASFTQPIQINGPPEIQLDIPVDQACGPWVSNATVQSSGLISEYLWDFGPLFFPSTQANPVFPVFPAPIINDTLYYIQLTASNNCGIAVDYDSVRIRPQPVAEIQTDYSQGCNPMNVNLQNISIGSPDSFSWNFGNGQTSVDSLPGSLILTATDLPQVYQIQLVIQNECGTSSDVVSVTVFPDSISLNSLVPQSACAPYSFSFDAGSTDQTFYLWEFGDGVGSIGPQVSHTYLEEGSYTLQLTVSNFCVSDTAATTITLLEGPSIDFTLSSEAICAGSVITLNNNSANANQYEWLPGNGETITYANPLNLSFTEAGPVSVGLAGTHPENGCRDTLYQNLMVYSAPEILVSADPDTGCAPFSAQFLNSTSGANSWEWQFSNGEVSTNMSPTVQFSGSGSFSASLIARNIISNSEVCADTATVSVFVWPKPVSSFELESSAECGPPAIVQTINTSAANLQFSWEWDGNSDLSFAPLLSFSDTGMFDVRLVVANEFSCSDTSTNSFEVLGTPQLDWSIAPAFGCSPLSVQLINSSSLSESVFWSLSNGLTSENDTFQLSLNEPGFYDVQLRVSHENGQCTSDTLLAQGIEVFPTPVAGFTPSTLFLTEANPLLILQNTSSGYSSLQFEVKDELFPELPLSYQFLEGDTGFFNLILYAENTFGCRDTFMQQVQMAAAPVYYLPSSFTPNGDGINDEFKIEFDRKPEDFELYIFNRWGEKVFFTDNWLQGWKGTKDNRDGERVQDVYVLKVNLRFFGQEPEEIYRNITLIH